MRPFTFFALVLIGGCSSNNKSLEARFKDYMKDSVAATTFNDPASYEFVSIKIDSVTNHQYAEMSLREDSLKLDNLNDKIKLDSLEGIDNARDNYKTSLQILRSEIEGYNKDLAAKDYVYKINAMISYRAKNKLGAKVLDQTKLYYLPFSNKIEQGD